MYGVISHLTIALKKQQTICHTSINFNLLELFKKIFCSSVEKRPATGEAGHQAV
jgi:hypothetical protein